MICCPLVYREGNVNIKLLDADYHRNGSGGDGFYVARFQTTGEPDTAGRTFIAVLFSDGKCTLCNGYGHIPATLEGPLCPKCHGVGATYGGGKTAVLDLDEAAKGDIYMFPEIDKNLGQVEGTGGNSWRGADYYGKTLFRLVAAFDAEQHKRMSRRLEAQQKQASIERMPATRVDS